MYVYVYAYVHVYIYIQKGFATAIFLSTCRFVRDTTSGIGEALRCLHPPQASQTMDIHVNPRESLGARNSCTCVAVY